MSHSKTWTKEESDILANMKKLSHVDAGWNEYSDGVKQSTAYTARRDFIRAYKRPAGSRGDHNRRLIFSKIAGDREVTFHATKGWRNNRRSA